MSRQTVVSFWTALFPIILTMLSSAQAHGQAFIAVQGEIAEPVGAFRDVAGTGRGIRASLYLHSSPEFSWILSSGYTTWGPRQAVPGTEYKISVVPATIGMQWTLARNTVTPFVGVSTGGHFLRSTTTAANSSLPGASAEENEVRFVFSPHFGLALHVIGPVGLIATVTYEMMYTSKAAPARYIGLRGGLAAGF